MLCFRNRTEIVPTMDPNPKQGGKVFFAHKCPQIVHQCSHVLILFARHTGTKPQCAILAGVR